VGSTLRQRRHYSKLAQQEAARLVAIGALVRLAEFPDDRNAAIRSLRLLEAHPSEMGIAAVGLRAWVLEPGE
jgi:hypothetical protein